MPPAPFTRITLCLPVNDPHERSAANKVIARLKQDFGGATFSDLSRPAFRGHWFAPDGTLYIDRITFVFTDVPRDLSDAGFVQALDDLRAAACQIYEQAGSPQHTIWLQIQQTQGFVDPCLIPSP